MKIVKPFFRQIIFFDVKRYLPFIVIVVATLLFSPSTTAQSRRSQQYEEYIEKFYQLAQEHQRRYGIPASITLAQGLLESGAGTSELSRKANNHFGIKCHEWDGATIYYKRDCYRKYRKAEDSYLDHSEFLLRDRYQKLFKLKITDYKGWAHGLKKYGYATDPSYAQKLINIIELYDLNRFVKKAGKSKNDRDDKTEETPYQPVVPRHAVFRSWGLLYVEAYEGDTYQTIAADFGFSPKELARYNDSKTDVILSAGDIVYLEKKNKKAVEGYNLHTVKEGETLHFISQQYGIELKHLAKRNKMRRDAVLTPGQTLKLR